MGNDPNLEKELIKYIKMYESDKDFIRGILFYCDNDEDRIELLNFIKRGKEVEHETIIVYAIKLSDRRYGDEE